MRELLLRAAHHGVPQVLGSIVALAGVGIGLSLMIAPEPYLSNPAWSQNFNMLSATAWGSLFMIASALLVVTVWVDTEHAQLPALMLGAIYIVFGLLSLLSGVTAILWAFVALGWVSIFTQIVCWAKGRHETVLYSHQPN